VADPCTVLIAADDLLPALKERGFEDGGELLAFSDSEALRALDVISRRRPRLVALEEAFAATPRGAALINRIKADPTLSGSAIRVVACDAESRVVSRAAANREIEPIRGTAPLPASAPAAVVIPAPALDTKGTRRSPRYAIGGAVEVIVDGNRATLVELSVTGAQVLSLTILKPNQKLRMTMADHLITMRFNAIVAWAFFEMPPKIGPRDRCGLEFLNANAADVDAYRLRLTGPAEPL
jgi:hypothetical protein